VINPSGGEGIYGKVHFKNRALGIVVLDDQLNTYLVGQFRFAIDAYSWEIPEGGGPLDEDPLSAAKRELLEETGIEAGHWEKILYFHLSNSVSDEYGHVYLARSLTFKDASPEETEQLELRKLPFEEAYQMVLRGEITDSLAVAGILRVKIMLTEKRGFEK
jgi:8-oxo-dGTP pyrophosphatase MutT (NUDIX family)